MCEAPQERVMIVKTVWSLIPALVLIVAPLAKAEDDGEPQPAAPSDQVDVAALLLKVDATARAVTAVSYDAEFFGEGDYAEDVPRITGTVQAGHQRKSLLGRLTGRANKRNLMRFDGLCTKPGSDEGTPFKIATDGKKVYRTDECDKTFVKGDLPGAAALLGRSGLHPLYMREFLHRTPFSDEINAKVARHEGYKTIGGVACHVVYVVYLNNSKSRWYFGKEDYLPRRVDRIIIKQNNRHGWTALVVKNLDTSPVLEIDDFHLDCPEGYGASKQWSGRSMKKR
jgi:hypothetical protein